MKGKRIAATVLFGGTLLGTAAASRASPIVYSVSDTASGTLGGTAFTNAVVTVSFASDTSTVTGSGGFYSTTVGTGYVTIGANAPVALTDVGQVDFFDNQSFGGIAYAGIGDGPSILDTGANAFASYSGTTPLGPTTGQVFFNAGDAFATTAGQFVINSAGATSTFTAAVPEPAALATLAFVGLAGLSRRRRRRT